jgi:hypothetical protein
MKGKGTTVIPSALIPILDSGDIQRWHTVRTCHPQNNAHHCWGAAVFAMFLYKPVVCDQDWIAILEGCLLHDAYEIVTGDVPSMIKWDNPSLKTELGLIESYLAVKWEMFLPSKDTWQLAAIKVCDCCDAARFAAVERSMGNGTTARLIFGRMDDHIRHIKGEFPDDNVIKSTTDKAIDMLWRIWEGAQ